MKVLIDIRPLGRGGSAGIPVFTKEITDRLISQAGTDTYELFYPGLRKNELPKTWTAHERVTVRDWKLPNKLLDIANRWFSGPDLGKLTDADIILSPHFNNLNKGRTPRILVIHDISFVHHPEFFSRKQRFWHWLQNWRKQLTDADHLITVSHYTKEDLVKTLGIAPEKISVIYPGISQEFRPLDPHDQGRLRFEKRHEIKTPYFLYLGALESRKNITQLVAAFDALRTNPKFKGYQLIIAGVPGYGAKTVQKAMRRSASKSAIRILPRVTDEERIFLYNGAVAFVCTSFFEGFGFPPLEAQACGVPVIASSRTSFIETLGDSALLIDPWKASDLTNALITLASDETTRAEKIKVGLLNSKRFRWDEATDHIHSILKKSHTSLYAA